MGRPRLPRPVADLGSLLGMPADLPQRLGYAPTDEEELFFGRGAPGDPVDREAQAALEAERRAVDRSQGVYEGRTPYAPVERLAGNRRDAAYEALGRRAHGVRPGVFRDPMQEGAQAGVRLTPVEQEMARIQEEQDRLLARRDRLLGTPLQTRGQVLDRRDRLMEAARTLPDPTLARRDRLLNAMDAAYAGARRQQPTTDPLEEVARLHGARPRVGFDSIARRNRGR